MNQSDLFQHTWDRDAFGNQYLCTTFNLTYSTVLEHFRISAADLRHTEAIHETVLLRKVRKHDELIDEVRELRDHCLHLTKLGCAYLDEIDEIDNTFKKIIGTLQGRPDPIIPNPS